MAIERKIDGATFADLANTVRRLREKFADLPEDQEIAEAERATLEVREAMRNSASVPGERAPNGQD